MSGRGRYRGGNRNRNDKSMSLAQESVASLPANSPVLAMFKNAAVRLNERQDRHERLVKLSRDITIESKRIIFLLHSAITKESAEVAVSEANERLKKLVNGPFMAIGLELEYKPAYLHSWAVTAGMQEFIEARTFCSLMEYNRIITYEEVQKELTYTIKDQSKEEETERVVKTMLTYSDYMLGLADLTGELMRKAINSIASGDNDKCFNACQVVRDLYTGYLGLFGIGKELASKTSTTRNNVAKVEAAVYALKVRGKETPPTLVLPTLPAPQHWDNNPGEQNEDEGYY